MNEIIFVLFACFTTYITDIIATKPLGLCNINAYLLCYKLSSSPL